MAPASAASATNTMPTPTADADKTAMELPDLLSALAAGVRSSRSIPVGDDYDFHSSLHEVSDVLQEAQAELLQLLQDVLLATNNSGDRKESNDHDGDQVCHYDDLEDPLLWQDCSEACEFLIEHADSYLQQSTSHGSTTTTASLQQLASHGRSQVSRIVDNTVDMAKPQLQWQQQQQQQPIDNERSRVFVPAAHPTKPHSITPLDLSLQPGHGLESRFGSLRSVKVPVNIVAPSHHVAHVYESEIKALQYSPEQLQALEPSVPYSKKIPQVSPLSATWVDSPQALQQLLNDIESSHVKEIAIDLEAHSYRSFAGITCLMQLSYKEAHGNDSDDSAMIRNALIDTLALRFELTKYLQPLLANPAIVKVFHGADSDIAWLQRDFGLYVVNLFDTGRAATALGLPKRSYAYLLSHYVDIVADKSFQLSDWRQRPLTPEMQHYAIQDTHYLIDIYHRIKYDLQQKDVNLISQVLDVSKKVSLIRYAGEPFDPDGYKSYWEQQQARRRRQSAAASLTNPTHVQEAVFRALWDWRDRVARRLDESTLFVCDKQPMFRIAMAHTRPTSVRMLQSLFTTTPPIILERAAEILDLIKEAAANACVADATPVASTVAGTSEQEAEDDDTYDDEDEDDADDDEIARQSVGAPSSAFIKPPPRSDFRPRGGMSSPVLATDDLYREAGWTTPEVPDALNKGTIADVVTTTDDEDGYDGQPPGDGEKPRRTLKLHVDNKFFASKRMSNHTLAILENNRTEQTDGLATVAVAVDGMTSDPAKLADQCQRANQISAQVGIDLANAATLSSVLGINAPTLDIEDPETEDDIDGRSDGADTDEEDFPIPRSMREIYKISNRNRRNKKTGSPTPERGTTPTSEREKNELAKAEALLRERGLLNSPFFTDGASKKQRTKVATGRESEETVPQDEMESVATRQEDMAIVKEIGWASEKGFTSIFGAKIGLLDPLTGSQAANPFFSGAALVGGPLAQEFARQGQQPRSSPKRNATGRGSGKAASRRERPEKKDGKTTYYRKH